MTPGRRRLILFTLTATVGTYVLTVVMANVSLPQMQGAFSATPDQITWVVTSNLLATAVATPLSGWLAGRFGRRQVMLWSSAVFTFSTTMCGLATSLEELVMWRALQGFAGAPLLPLSQSIILEIYPRQQHSRVLVLWSMGVTIGSIFAPLLGGWASEEYSWRWVFLMIIPPAVACFVGLWAYVTDPVERLPSRPFDWYGFSFLAIAVASLQLMLDRGQRLDWFNSNEIVLEACFAVLAFYLFIVHVLTSDRPFLNLRLLLDRNYAVGLLLGLVFGMLYFTPLVLQSTMLGSLVGYPDSLIGVMQAVRGVGLLGGSLFLLFCLQSVDPRISLFLGFLIQGLSGYAMSLFDLNMTTWAVAWTAMLQGFGVGMMWSPITVVTFASMSPRNLPEGASVFHLLRNVGSSVHIAFSAALVVRSGRVSYSEIAESLNPFSEAMRYPSLSGGWNIAGEPGMAALGAEIGRQANMVGYINTFYAYSLAAAVVMPLVFLARRPEVPK